MCDQREERGGGEVVNERLYSPVKNQRSRSLLPPHTPNTTQNETKIGDFDGHIICKVKLLCVRDKTRRKSAILTDK